MAWISLFSSEALGGILFFFFFFSKVLELLQLCRRRGTHNLSPGLQRKLNQPLCLCFCHLQTTQHRPVKVTLLLKTFTYRIKSSAGLSWSGPYPTSPAWFPAPPLPYSVFLLPSTYYLNISCSLVSQCHCNDYSCCLGCPCFTGKLLQVLPDPLCFDISLNASLTLGSTWKLVPIGLLPQLLTPPALSGLPPAQLLDGWISEAFPDAALFPLHSLRAGCTSKLRLHLDHAGSNHVAFPT